MRRTHCRHCGKIFCRACCKGAIPIPNLSYLSPVPVCTFCTPQVLLSGGEPWKSVNLGYDGGPGMYYEADLRRTREKDADLISKFQSESETEDAIEIEDTEPRQ